MDGLGSHCFDCRKSSRKKLDRKDYNRQLYEDNPVYFKMKSKAKYLEKRANQMIVESEHQEHMQKQLDPESPFVSFNRLTAEKLLREARKLRRMAGKPTK